QNASPAVPVAHKAMRVLLVEDHEDTNRSLTQLLRRRGYHVQPAHSVQTALEAEAQERYDVLISEIGQPDGSGIDLMAKLKDDHPIFGIALTGFGMEDDLRKSHEVGFNHHLVKPVDLNRLDALIQQADLVTVAAKTAGRLRALFRKALEICDNLRANTARTARIRKAPHMGRIFYFALGLLMATSALAADAVDEEKPHGRVCLSVFEPGPPEKEEAFQISASAAAGKIVR